MRIKEGSIEVEWVALGEGWDGDYNPDDPEDTELLRFDVYKDGEMVEDASYCTQVPADTPEPEQRRLLKIIMDEVRSPLEGDNSIKKLCERLSWIDPNWE